MASRHNRLPLIRADSSGIVTKAVRSGWKPSAPRKLERQWLVRLTNKTFFFLNKLSITMVPQKAKLPNARIIFSVCKPVLTSGVKTVRSQTDELSSGSWPSPNPISITHQLPCSAVLPHSGMERIYSPSCSGNITSLHLYFAKQSQLEWCAKLVLLVFHSTAENLILQV